MKTEVITIDCNCIDKDKLKFAAEVLKGGGLVAFPTETVYGLGANALSHQAVNRIFTAKGRPSDNPLIVHVANQEDVHRFVKSVTSNAKKIMDTFWPGPITLVMDKSEVVPDLVTAGLNTVAVRMPANPIALALIVESGVPVAAPSANTSGKPSPTIAQHVIEDLMGRVDVIIDGGNASVGVESTVIDVTVYPPVILRPGGVTLEQLEKLVGEVGIDPAIKGKLTEKVKPKSPGMKYTHYSPKAQVFVVDGERKKVIEKINGLANQYAQSDIKCGIMATDQTRGFYSLGEVISAGDRDNPATIASNLFRILREFDERGVQVILAEAVEDRDIGMAVMNRMSKAAGYNIINV